MTEIVETIAQSCHDMHMDKLENHPHSSAVQAYADALAKLDSATAHAVTNEAREMIENAWLRQEIQRGRDSGTPLSEDEVFDSLLAEADADIEAASR